jgi:hydroxyacylglutathione hydrolase
MESLGKLEKLDLKVVYPGHGKSFTDVAGAIGRARRRLEGFLGNKEKIGNDLLKKIIIYTLLMKKGTEESSFFDQLMTTLWFRENVDFYFEGNYRSKYDEIMNGFYRRGIVKIKCDKLFTSVKP